LQEVNGRLGADRRLAVRIGIHTGPVVVGEVGGGARRETLALGETTNVAARLQGLAAPDAVIMSAATQRLVPGRVAVEDLGAQTLKGIAQPMRAFRLLAATEARGRLAAPSGLVPFVGRELELAILRDRWRRASEAGGQAVVLLGEPGIGKSRLIAEFR